jgi:osmotically-inducible protein OsmY
MRPDADIKRDVEAELQWDPDIRSDDIAVAVKDGVVALTGFVRSYNQRWQAEAAAKRVKGVVAVANDINVRLPLINQRPDPEIARDIVMALRSELPWSFEQIKAVVSDGRVTLEGRVEWNYQRERAANAAQRVRSVKSLTNSIEVKPPAPAPERIKEKIEEALKRNAEIDASRVSVETKDDTVILRGKVLSWAESREAERAAWAAPGVGKVDNQLVVSL